MKIKHLLFLLCVVFFQQSGHAQMNNDVEMATGLYQSGKIYVVVGVLGIIFTGIVVYLILLDRKISKLENKQAD